VLIEDQFEVRAPIDQVWAYLLDVERVAPCMPGAELTEVVDDRTWKGKVNVKLGPVAMSFAGTVVLQARDDQAHRLELRADGREQRGKGAASATATASLEAVEGGTQVSLHTDLTITGAAAQYGRGMLGDISKRLTGDFARCLEGNIGAAAPLADVPVAEGAGTEEEAPVRPVQGLRLAAWALWRAVVRFFRRLFAGG
jgi:carbon monoxide dehydrogenase subunit G